MAKTFTDLGKDQLIKVCYLNQDFNPEDVAPAQFIDVVILQTFDALTSYEQLLVKCSAVLGDIFPRDMLLYIMSSSIARLTALGFIFQLIYNRKYINIEYLLKKKYLVVIFFQLWRNYLKFRY